MLNDGKIKAAKPRKAAYRLGDSGQLYLQVTPSGGKHWRMNYTFGRNLAGKPIQKTLSFGSYPAVTLLNARAKRDEAKRVLSQGRDPAEERRAAELAQASERQNSFRAATEAWFELHSGWSLEKLRESAMLNAGKWSYAQADRWTTDPHARWSAVHSSDVLVSLERDVLPLIGGEPIAELKAPAVLALLRAVEKRGAIETAHRLRQRISAVFVYGIAAGLCDGDPVATLSKALKPVPESKHQPSIVDEERDREGRISAVRQMLLDCEAQRCRGQTKLALRLLALTAVRPGDLTGARWTEFVDLGGKAPTWVVPASRMKGIKAKKGSSDFDHHVPLSRQAIDVLDQLRRLTGKFQFCFPGERQVSRSISENTLRALLIRAGYHQRHVPHGFRAAFSTIMNERAKELGQDGDRAVIDLMLAHVPQASDKRNSPGTLVSGSEDAYNRAAYMPRRRQLAQEWADILFEGFWPAETLLEGPIRWAANGPGRPR
ncbi:tyrosine-type recombinase/integrase [Sphingopyxis witflariensis]|uniref:tyrosine-type recombinase/integrase n=1 Tax=Sphingopyxis witflariensis TaxID=173675 RepID=UPI001F419516|nr:integrase arm-type DNA-binding domain-containing protein [Sphingopyxis witflariensis]